MSELHDAIAEAFLMPQAEVEVEWVKGQANGLGEIEWEFEREWFRPERNTHRRKVITIYGPWEKIDE